MKKIKIGKKTIGKENTTFVIAEAGVNHNGDVALAEKMIVAAKKCGADAIKFQSFRAAQMCDIDLTETKDVEGITGGTKSSYDMYKSLELSDKAHEHLAKVAKEEDILFSSSVFDLQMPEFLDQLGVPFFKISSGDITYFPLLEHVASFKKPIIISTGMSTIYEVMEAVNVCHLAGNEDIVLLHCNSNYPPPLKEVNLNSITTMQNIFNFPIGFSDHTLGIYVSLAAVSLGAFVIEKHFTLDNNLPGPDQKLSLDALGFKNLVQGIKDINEAKGSFEKMPSASELPNIFSGRRSLVAAVKISKGQKFSLKDIKIIKPAKGIEPKFLKLVLGKEAKRDIEKFEAITWDSI